MIAILLRVAVAFVVLLVLTRLAGKKQLRQTTFFDFITAIAVGDIAAEKIADPKEPLLPWVGAAVLWFGLAIALDLLVLKDRRLGKLVAGEPTVVIENGKILEKNLYKNFLRVDDLIARLREKGQFNLADVEFAIFETDGELSVLPKSQVRPLQPRDLKIATQYEGISRELVVDRQVNRSNLKLLNLSHGWLLQELNRQGYEGPQDVFFAAIDTQGRLYIDGFKDPVAGSRIHVNDAGPH